MAQADNASFQTELHAEIVVLDSLFLAEQFEKVIARARHALMSVKENLGTTDSTVARLMNILANCFMVRSTNVTLADSLYRMSLSIAETTTGDSSLLHLDVLTGLMRLEGRWEAVESLATRTLTLREEILGPEHSEVALNLLILGKSFEELDRFTDAEPLYRRALAIWTKDYGVDHPAIAKGKYALASWLFEMDQRDESIRLMEEALTVRKDALGLHHTLVAMTKRSLAKMYFYEHQFADAEQLFEEAQSSDVDHFGPEHPETVKGLEELGVIYRNRGKYVEAEEVLKRAINISEKFRGTANYEIHADVLQGLGVLYYMYLGKLAEGETLVKQSLSIMEETREPGQIDGDIAITKITLAQIYIAQERYAEAESILRRLLAWSETVPNPRDQGKFGLANLAGIYMAKGQYAAAQAIYFELLENSIRVFGPDHVEVTNSFGTLAVLYAYMNQIDSSVEYFRRSLHNRLNLLRAEFSYSSEYEKLKFLRLKPIINSGILALAEQSRALDAKLVALEMCLKGKAFVIDAVSAERVLAYCAEIDEIGTLLEQHANVGEKIASTYLTGFQRLGPDLYQDSILSFNDLRDSLEIELSRICSAFEDQFAARKLEVQDVARALPKGSSLWEIIAYTPYDFRKVVRAEKKRSPPRYMGFQLSHDGSIAMEDLGEVRYVDSLIASFQDLTYGTPSLIRRSGEAHAEGELSAVTGQLYETIFAPLEKHLSGSNQIFVSPDGALSLLPFDVLMGPDSKYIIEKYRISYLSTGRDLVKYVDLVRDKGGYALIIADPNFKSDASATTTPFYASTVAGGSDPARMVLRGPTDRNDCLDLPFNRLQSTRAEGKAVADLLVAKGSFKTDYYFGKNATEHVLKNPRELPRVIHLATHGYFCARAGFTGEAKLDENPLLYSGLALAGANRVVNGEVEYGIDAAPAEDGILTSLEASGLNLMGTELVVLSACQTGVGSIENGEGVYGLRRAFQLAGARSVIMSMFAVPDKSTQTLMTRFYTNWLEGQSKASALRQAALSIIRERRANGGAAHPLFWGGFVLVGDPN